MIYSFILCILFKSVSCIIWENLFLDAILISDKNFNGNRTEKYLNMTEMPKFFGYPAEEYTVTTKDGYRLKMCRIPGKGPPVLLMHGIFNSADDYMTLGARSALSFKLSDAGYDVWLGNVRGNKYSIDHETLDPKHQQFWNFTFHEIGVYDLPAMIDFILLRTNKTKLTYVGHSQGTTVFFVMASMLPEYNDKVNLMISMATIAWTGNIRSPVLRLVVPLRDPVYAVAISLGIYTFLPSDALTRFIFRDVCTSSTLAVLVCESLLFTLYGFDYYQINVTQAPVKLARIPAGASMKQMLHFMQTIHSKHFRQFDYGPDRNLLVYNSTIPSSYPVNKITTPIAILYSLNDWLSAFPDVQTFISNCPSVFDITMVPFERINHMDYLWAKEADYLIYNKVMALIKSRVKP